MLSDRAYIAADEASVSKIADEVIAFYQGISSDLWLYDADGRLPVVVYAFGFPEALEDTEIVDLVLHRACVGGSRRRWPPT